MYKNELVKILHDFKDYTKCIMLYGSNSLINNKKAGIDSDFDIMVVIKKNINPYEISSKIGVRLKNKTTNIDYSWYTESFLMTLINEHIDLFLFNSIFFTGEVLYSDGDYVTAIKKQINASSTTEGLSETYDYRKFKSNNLIRLFSRNLSRILFDYIGYRFCKINKLKEWSALKDYNEIIRSANEQNIIDIEVYRMMLRLQELSKCRIEEFGCNNRKVLSELVIYDKKIEELIMPSGKNMYSL